MHTETLRQELKEMLERKIIEPSTAEWSLPIVLVGKKDGTLRLCVDYRRLNELSIMDAYPMPRVDDMYNLKFIFQIFLTRHWPVLQKC